MHGIERDPLTWSQPGQNLEALGKLASNPNLAKTDPTIGFDYVDGHDFAAKDHGLRRHDKTLFRSQPYGSLDEHTGKQAGRRRQFRQIGANAEGIGLRIREREDRKTLRLDPVSRGQSDRDILQTPDGIDQPLRNVELDAQALETDAREQGRAGTHRFTDFDMTFGDNARIRSCNLRIPQLFASLDHSGSGGIETGFSRIERRTNPIKFRPRYQVTFVQTPDPIEFGSSLRTPGSGLIKTGLRLLHPRALLAVTQANDELTLFDEILDIKKDLDDATAGLRGDRGALDSFDLPVEHALLQ